MNRPNIEDYNGAVLVGSYMRDLEAYCDGIEAKLNAYISAFKHKIEMCEAEVFTITKRNIELEKALDKACERLADDYISSSKEWWKKEFIEEAQKELNNG